MATVGQSDHQAVNSSQKVAKLSDALEQFSLGQDGVITTTLSAEVLPTLVNIPLEIRRSIYHCFLKADETADANDSAKAKGKKNLHFDLTVLHLCRQLRSEGLEFLAKNNMWIGLSILSDQAADLDRALSKVPRIPYRILSPQEREILLDETSLIIELGETFDIRGIVPEKTVRQDVIFGYTAASYAIISEALSKLRNMCKTGLSITVAPKFSSRNHTIIEDLILPFAVARNSMACPDITINGLSNSQLVSALVSGMNRLNGTARDAQDHLLALKEEGNKFIAKGYLEPGTMYYSRGIELYLQLVRNGILSTLSTLAEANVVRSIFTDISNNWMHASNTLVAKLRNDQGVFPMSSISVILRTYLSSHFVLKWCGISNQQRQKAHYRRAIATQNLAECCSDPVNVQYMHQHHFSEVSMLQTTDPKLYFVAATEQYFFSMHADMFSKSAPYIESLYRKMSGKYNCFITESPTLGLVREVPHYEGVIWEGDPAIRLGRTDQQIRNEIESSISREDKTMTKKELKKMKRDLGMPGDQIDGLVRLLRPRLTEDTVHELEHEG